MNLSYDKVADAANIRFSNGHIHESEEIVDGIIVDYGRDGEVMGIEILNFSKKNLNLNSLILMDMDELIPALVECQ